MNLPIPQRCGKARVVLQATLIALVTAWVYLPAARGGWIWDDFTEIVRNPVVRAPAGIRDIWLAPSGPDYFPLKTSVEWLEFRLWGDSPAAFHWVSISLHALSAILLWLVLRRMGVRCAWIGGMIFAVHPLAVESVAWNSELKNTLSMSLVLLAALVYLRSRIFEQEGREETGRSGSTLRVIAYVGSIGLFILAMLAKSSVVMFPAIILLHAWWKRGRVLRSDLVASAPYFAVSLVLGLVTVAFQEHRAIAGADLAMGGLAARAAEAGKAVFFYLGKALVPVGLSPNYPETHPGHPGPGDFLPWLAIAAGLLLLAKLPRNRGALLGAGVFLLNLLPVLGLVPMAYLRISWVADHFAYLSLLGLAGLAAAAIGSLPESLPFRSLALVIVGCLAWQARSYARTYASDEVFWTTTLARSPDSWTAHNDLGMIREGQGRQSDAIAHYKAALRLKPDYLPARANLGNALSKSGDFGAAAAEYESVVAANPGFPGIQDELAFARYRIGNDLGNSGRYSEAIDSYEEALRHKPGYAEALANLGLALANAGRTSEAIARLGEALRLKPDYAQAQAYLGFALAAAGRAAEAITHYEAALALDPADADVHYNLALVLRQSGRGAEADAHFREAQRLGAGH